MCASWTFLFLNDVAAVLLTDYTTYRLAVELLADFPLMFSFFETP